MVCGKIKKGKYHLVFEFICGKNLKDCYKTLDIKQKLDVIFNISLILERLHNLKFIHRDIKPNNIMIEENTLNVKLIDFGLSKIAEKTETYTENKGGTPRYMAPEFYQVDKTKQRPIKITTKVDIWSLGCLISELFSSIVPWYNIDRNDFGVRKHLLKKKPFPIPQEIKDECFINLIEKCVDLEPKNRISAKELSDLVKKYLMHKNY